MDKLKERSEKELSENTPAPEGAEENPPDSEMTDMIAAAIAKKKEVKKAAADKKKRRAVILSCAAGVCVLAAVYFGGWAASMGTFLPNTYINGVPVGKLNVSAASAAVQAQTGQDSIRIIERGGRERIISPSDFDYSYDVFGEVQRLYRSVNRAGWIGAYFSDTYYETESKPVYSTEKLEAILDRITWGTVETRNAELVHGNQGYYISEAVYGDRADTEAVKQYVMLEFSKGNYTIDLEASGLYTAPTVFPEDLEDNLEELNSGFNYVITYDLGYAHEELTGAQVYDWMKNGGVIDKSKVEEYVDDLAEKYDTFMKPRKFTTTNRGSITIDQGRYSTGQYGWWTDREKTVEKLLEYIKKGESVTVEPEYVTLDTGYKYRGFEPARSESGDIGNTYIEVDLSAQHMWYYENGAVKFETDQIVSGKANDPKRKTPSGIYSVYSKSTNYTMKAADGSYTAKCSYFMRISFEGIGFHDLSRTAYGGNIYLTNGSHGCINMKRDEVKQLYELVEWGTPVILYY